MISKNSDERYTLLGKCTFVISLIIKLLQYAGLEIIKQ